MRPPVPLPLRLVVLLLLGLPRAEGAESPGPLTIGWTNNLLTIAGGRLPVPITIHYLEAYCRPGSTARAWDRTVIPHRTALLAQDPAGRRIELADTLTDGVIVNHVITTGPEDVDFRVMARNPTSTASEAQWVQPCIRVGRFTGARADDAMAVVPEYARKCFIFLDGKLTRLPTAPWSTTALYVPGQVWSGPGVNRDDVNPRPLSPLKPSNGLIGCFSADERLVLAAAWDAWQELFQGVIHCIHSDFRVGGLAPGETKRVHGKLYVVPANEAALLRRYREDFGESRHAGPNP